MATAGILGALVAVTSAFGAGIAHADPPAVRLLDSFDRADSAALGIADSGQPWLPWFGSAGVTGNQAAPSGGYSLSVIDSGGTTGAVTATVAQPSDEFWLVLRAADQSNYWRFGRWQSGAYQLQQIAGNALASPPLSLLASVQAAAGDILGCELRNDGIQCSVNGVTVVATTDTTGASATLVGFAVWDPSWSMTTRFDSLSVTDLSIVPDLAVNVTDLDPVFSGGLLRWTATITNVGLAAAGPTSVTLTLPSGLNDVSVTTSVGSCTASSCDLGPLAAGATATVVVEAVAPTTLGPVMLTVAATSAGAANPANDSRSETTTVQAAPPPGTRAYDTFERSDSPTLGSAQVGGAWTLLHGSAAIAGGRARPGPGYTLASLDGGGDDGRVSLKVTSVSPEFWMAVRVADGANYWRFGRSQSGNYQLQQIVGNGLGTPSITTSATVVPADGDVLSCRFLGAALGCSVNGTVVASVAGGANPTARGVGFAVWDPPGVMTTRFDDVVVVDLPTAPDLAVAVTDFDPVASGRTMRWTASVVNNGLAPAATTVAFTLPTGLTGVSATASAGSCTATACDLGTLPVGASASIVVNADAPAPGAVTLTVAAAAPGAVETADDTRSETTTVAPAPPPDVRVLDEFDRADAATLGYTLTTDQWRQWHGSASVVSGQARPGPGYTLAAVDGGGADGHVSLRIATLAPEFWLALRVADGANYWRFGRSQSGTYQLQQIVSNNLGTPVVTMAATVSPANGDVLSCRYVSAAVACSVNGSVVASAATGANPAARGVGFSSWDPAGSLTARFDDLVVLSLPTLPDLAVALTDEDPVFVGTSLQYTATVDNVGTAASAATTLTVTLPAGVAPATITPSQGTCTAGPPVSCSLGSMAVGARATVGITAPAPTQASTVSATAAVATSGDSSPANDTDTETTWVRTPPAPGARVLDTFERTGTTLGTADTGEPWTQYGGSFTLASGGVAGTTSQPSVAAVHPGWQYGTHEVTVDEVGDGKFWVAFRVVDANNYFRVGPAAGTGIYRLEKVVNGIAQPVAIYIQRNSVVAADGDRIRVVTRPDDGIFVSVNGIHIYDAGDTQNMHVANSGFAIASTTARVDAIDIGQVITSGIVSGDDFNRHNSPTSMGVMSVGTHYAYFPFSGGAWGINDDEAYKLGDTYGSMYVDAASEAADVGVTVAAVSDEFAVTFRWDEFTGEYFRFGRLTPGGAYDVDLIHGWVASAPAGPVDRLATVMPAAGDVLEVLQFIDGRIEAYVNGVLVLRFTDTTVNPRSTLYGFASLGSLARFDNLTITPE